MLFFKLMFGVSSSFFFNYCLFNVLPMIMHQEHQEEIAVLYSVINSDLMV